MNTFLWILQVLLAIIFLTSGISKSVFSIPQLIEKGQTGVEGFSSTAVRTIALCELAGVIGIIVPWLTGIAPVLTPATALGFALIMVFAIPIHYKRYKTLGHKQELKNVIINSVILAATLWVAYGRWKML